jgi:hypothetical protein
MLTDADHVWHAMYFKHPHERARYIKSQIPHADAEHLLRKNNTFPKIYRDDLVEFAVIVNGKVINTVQKRQEAHDLAQQQEGYVIVVDVPKSESRHPQYDRYYQEIIKTPLVPSKEQEQKHEEPIQAEDPKEEVLEVETTEEQTTTTTTTDAIEPVQVKVETTEEQTTTTTTTTDAIEPVQVEVETTEEQTTTTTDVVEEEETHETV